MKNKYLGSFSMFCDYLVENYGFGEDDLDYIEYENYEEDVCKHDVICSGFIKLPTENYYLFVSFASSYDWGPDNYVLYTEKYEKTQEVITKTVDVFKPIKE